MARKKVSSAKKRSSGRAPTNQSNPEVQQQPASAPAFPLTSHDGSALLNADLALVSEQIARLPARFQGLQPILLQRIRLLPVELQNLIWNHIVLEKWQVTPGGPPGRPNVYASVTAGGEIAWGERTMRKVLVNNKGHNKLLSDTTLVYDPVLLRGYFREASKEVTFLFDDVAGLRNFGEQLLRYFPYHNVPRGMSVYFSMLRESEKFARLNTWVEQDVERDFTIDSVLHRYGPHGTHQKAYEHVKEWMDALEAIIANVSPAIPGPATVQNVLGTPTPHAATSMNDSQTNSDGSNVKEKSKKEPKKDAVMWLDIGQARPWRDYRGLRTVTSYVREAGADIVLRLREARWEHIPDREFHIGVTISTWQGKRIPRQDTITEDEAETLSRHGCRGFRGLSR